MEHGWIILGVFLQTLGIALLFLGAGHFLLRKLAPEPFGANGCLRISASYFLGLSAFLAAYLFISRLVGARLSLWIVMTAMAVLLAREIWVASRDRPSIRASVTRAVVLGLLVVAYSISNAALWIDWGRYSPIDVGLWTHFGSIHAGRYANYAIFIADQDRIPFLAQNGGQSMLASVHLLLGVQSPLTALMAWIPVSLAFLTLLVFGLFRLGGYASVPCGIATALVMLGNTAVSAIHVLVFDNGSPLAFVGYADMVAAVATFLLLSSWLAWRVQHGEAETRRSLAAPFLFGLTWCWYAPQNLVIAASSWAGLMLVRYLKPGTAGPARVPVKAALVFLVAAVIGATQFGSLLPSSWREHTGYWAQESPAAVFVRPYIRYVRNHWTAPTWNVDSHPVMDRASLAKITAFGRDELYRNVSWQVEDQLWDSLRIFGFPILGLLLMRRRLASAAPSGVATHTWWWLSLFAFASGFAIYFGLELGSFKWWVSRFLVPGAALAMMCLGFVVRDELARPSSRARKALWTLLAAAVIVGPALELAAVAWRNFVANRSIDSIERRIGLLAASHGPFVFEDLAVHPEAAARGARGWIVIGAEGRAHGLAISTETLHLGRGKHRVGFRFAPGENVNALEGLDVDVEVVGASTGSVRSRRKLRAQDLEKAADGPWGWLDFELPEGVPPVRIRLWNQSAHVISVTYVRFERRP
jgi:hypothetical protein